MKVLFKETQRINFFWKGLILFLLAVILLVNVYLQSKSETGFKLDGSVIGFLAFGLLVILSSFGKMETEIDETGVSVRFFPVLLKKKTFLWSDIDSFFVREYNPIQEFGGWSVFRINTSTVKGLGSNRALNVKGNEGLQLILKDGSTWLIGTQKASELREKLGSTKFV